MQIFKYKKTIIFAAIAVVIVALVAYSQYKKANTPPSYETVKVERGTLKQTVEATGQITSADELSLRFEYSGKVSEVMVKEGDPVKSGQVLMRLNSADLDAAVAQALANLNQKLAGATPEDLIYFKSAVDVAKASMDQARADGEHSIMTAQSAVDSAYNNLKLAEGGENSEIVSNAYENAVVTLRSSMSTMDNSMTQADNILGVDNYFANDDFEVNLGNLDSTKLPYAQDLYGDIKILVVSAKTAINVLSTASPRADIDGALIQAETALNGCIQLLSATKEVLTATAPVGTLSQSSLDAKKTIIESARTSASSQYNSVIMAKQNIETAKNSYTTFSIAYERALRDLDNTRTTSASNISIKEASYRQAVSNYDAKKNPPREVDVASLRAAVSMAVANRNKAILKAPIDGVVTKVYKKRGEFISMSEPAIEMLSPHYEVEVDIPETDVIKLKLQDSVVITLDAYGDDIKFSGKVLTIDPASTEVQDVVYYRVKVALDDSDKDIKPGMTANVTVSTASIENVLYLPLRAVRTNSERYVKVLVNGETKDVPVVLGLRADDGLVEIAEGVNEGDVVILGVKAN
jgi:HlyD family secretion protein